jgi:hypothetical protein
LSSPALSGPAVKWQLAGTANPATVPETGTSQYFRVQVGEVYSLNVVGYLNLTLQPGLNLIANQLDVDGTGTNNTVDTVFSTNLPVGSVLYALNGSQYLTSKFLATGKWDAGVSGIAPYLSPGSGVFVNNPGPSPLTLTLVGLVIQGTHSVAIPPHGGVTVISAVSPISGGVQSTLGYTPTVGDTVYPWNSLTQTYGPAHKYLLKYPAQSNWTAGGDYTISAGEAFLLGTGPSNTNTTWTQTFAVD